MKILILFSVVFLNACSSLSKSDCKVTNWKQKGMDDAILGIPVTAFQKYQDQCQNHGLSIPKQEYITGYEEGLKGYCNYDKGYWLGYRGNEQFHECDEISKDFSQGYRKGYQEFQALQAEENKQRLKADAITDIIQRYGTKECVFDADCDKQGQCASPTACRVEGHCKSVSEYIYTINEWVEARVCD